MSDQNLVWSDILANEIIRTGLNVWQFWDWSDVMSDHFRKVIIPTAVYGTELARPHESSVSMNLIGPRGHINLQSTHNLSCLSHTVHIASPN